MLVIQRMNHGLDGFGTQFDNCFFVGNVGCLIVITTPLNFIFLKNILGGGVNLPIIICGNL